MFHGFQMIWLYSTKEKNLSIYIYFTACYPFKTWNWTSLTWWQPYWCHSASALGPECWCPVHLGSLLSNSAPDEMNSGELKQAHTHCQNLNTEIHFSKFSFWNGFLRELFSGSRRVLWNASLCTWEMLCNVYYFKMREQLALHRSCFIK